MIIDNDFIRITRMLIDANSKNCDNFDYLILPQKKNIYENYALVNFPNWYVYSNKI